ncbi:MAG: GNAT family N-acetyltransferase [Candidatus Nealsonbacteria bacterium]|nr:GNAT family N-acetyltransferase [Candidatus Nealsonbacteria bacterium]
MIRVEEINDPARLPSCRLFWNLLVSQTPGASFFHSLDWFEVYLKHFAAQQRLRVLIVSSGGKAIGILPLVVRTELTRVGPVRVLTYPLDGWGTFFGPIGPNPTATLAAGLRHVRQTERDWDVLDLRWVDLQGDDRGRTQTAMRQVGFSPRKQGWDQAPAIDLDGTWDEYWNGRQKKWRQNVERCSRRLAERGKVTHVRYRPEGAAGGNGDPRWDLYDVCTRLAQSSWQGSSTTGTTLSHPAVGDYLRETHAAAARAGAVDLNLLLLEDRPIAFAYNYHYQGRVFALRKGFDPEFSAVRPGLDLDRRVLQGSFALGDTQYDMGEASLDSKCHWQTSIQTSYRFTHFPVAINRVQFLRVKRWFQDRVYGQEHIACA